MKVSFILSSVILKKNFLPVTEKLYQPKAKLTSSLPHPWHVHKLEKHITVTGRPKSSWPPWVFERWKEGDVLKADWERGPSRGARGTRASQASSLVQDREWSGDRDVSYSQDLQQKNRLALKIASRKTILCLLTLLHHCSGFQEEWALQSHKQAQAVLPAITHPSPGERSYTADQESVWRMC